jgi:hypothetical protein
VSEPCLCDTDFTCLADHAPTLTEFLLARIAEDEEMVEPVMIVHPDRFLAECVAKRRIVEDLDTAKVRERVALHRVMRHLAAVYSDHPEYDEAWLA